MKLNLISLCLGAMLAPCLTMASTVSSPGSNSAPQGGTDITAGFEATGDDGTLSKTMTFKGDIFNAKANWAWKLGGKELSNPSGENILDLDSSAFIDSEVTLESLGSDSLLATVDISRKPIPIITGMTKRPYKTGGVGAYPKVQIKNSKGAYEDLKQYSAYGNAMVSIPVNGTMSDKTSVNGVARLTLGNYLLVSFSSGVRKYLQGTTSDNSGGISYITNNTDYIAWKNEYAKGSSLSSITMADTVVKSSFGNSSYTDVSGFWLTGLSKAEIAWKKNEVPETWTMPIEVKITMI